MKQEEVAVENSLQTRIFSGRVELFKTARGYGFISWENEGIQQKDIFVHFSDINQNGFRNLKKGQLVSFSVGYNKNGIIKATNVIVLQ